MRDIYDLGFWFVIIALVVIVVFCVAYAIGLDSAKGTCLSHGYPEVQSSRLDFYCVRHNPDEVVPVTKWER